MVPTRLSRSLETASGALQRPFQTEYTTLTEVNAEGGAKTIAKETWTVEDRRANITTMETIAPDDQLDILDMRVVIAQAMVPTSSIFCPAAQTEYTTLRTPTIKTWTRSQMARQIKPVRKWRVKSNNEALRKTTIRAANPHEATVSGFTRPMRFNATGDYGEGSKVFSQKRSTQENTDIFQIEDNLRHTNEVQFVPAGDDAFKVNMKMRLPEAALPRYNIMPKPKLASQACACTFENGATSLTLLSGDVDLIERNALVTGRGIAENTQRGFGKRHYGASEAGHNQQQCQLGSHCRCRCRAPLHTNRTGYFTRRQQPYLNRAHLVQDDRLRPNARVCRSLGCWWIWRQRQGY